MPTSFQIQKCLPYYTLTISEQLNLILREAAKNDQLPQGNNFSEVLLNAILTFQNDKTANKSLAVFTLAMGEEDDENTPPYALLRSLIYTADKDLVPESFAWQNQTLFRKILGDNNGPIGFQIAEGFDVVLHPYPEEEDYKNTLNKAFPPAYRVEAILSPKDKPPLKFSLTSDQRIICEELSLAPETNAPQATQTNLHTTMQVCYPPDAGSRYQIKSYQVSKNLSVEDYLKNPSNIEDKEAFFQAFVKQIGEQLARQPNFNCTLSNIIINTDSDGNWVFDLTNTTSYHPSDASTALPYRPIDTTRGKSTLPFQEMTSGYKEIDRIFDEDGDGSISLAFESLRIANVHDSYAFLLCLYTIADKAMQDKEKETKKEAIMESMRTLFTQCQTYLGPLPDNLYEPNSYDNPYAYEQACEKYKASALGTSEMPRLIQPQEPPRWQRVFLTPEKIRRTLSPDATPVHQMRAVKTTLKEAAPWQATIALFWYRLIDTFSSKIHSPAGDTPQLTRSETLASLFSGKTFDDLRDPNCRVQGWLVIDNASRLFLQGNRRFKNELVQQAQALLVASVYSHSDENDPSNTIERKLTEALSKASQELPALQENSELRQALNEKLNDMKNMVIQLKAAEPNPRTSIWQMAAQDVDVTQTKISRLSPPHSDPQ